MLKESLLAVTVVGFLGTFACGVFAIVPPKSCPKVSSLNKTIFTFAQYVPEDNEYVVGNISDYGTSNRWGFIVARIHASDGGKALNLANKSMSTLSGNPDLYQHQNENFWQCNYAIGHGYIAVAITPVPANVRSFVH